MGRAREKGETTKRSEICHVDEVMNLTAHPFIGPVSKFLLCNQLDAVLRHTVSVAQVTTPPLTQFPLKTTRRDATRPND